MELATVAFYHENGAELAYSDARDRAPDASWLRHVAFVEVHRHHRVVMRGTLAGHYIDVDGEADAGGRNTATGALVGALVGLAFGPAGFAIGLTGGATAGGIVEASHGAPQTGGLFDSIRADVPEGSSAIVLLAGPREVDAMIAALGGGRPVRHPLSDDELAALRRAVADAPAATPM